MSAVPQTELTVVIVSYRCRDVLRDCLASLEVNRAEVVMDVEVIDNASGDDTIGAALEFPWVIPRPLSENVGFARANNLGLARARGRAILVLNPDTVVPAGGLRRCLDELWSHPDVGLLTARLVDPEGRLDRRCTCGVPTLWSSSCHFTGPDRTVRGRRSRRSTVGWLPDGEAGDVESVSGAFMLLRRSALPEVGGFDEQFFMYAEDVDLSVRFIEQGWRAGQVVAGRRRCPRRRRLQCRRQTAIDRRGCLLSHHGPVHHQAPTGLAWAVFGGCRWGPRRDAARCLARCRGLAWHASGLPGAQGSRVVRFHRRWEIGSADPLNPIVSEHGSRASRARPSRPDRSGAREL